MRRQVVGDRLLSAGDDGAVRVWALAGPPSGWRCEGEESRFRDDAAGSLSKVWLTTRVWFPSHSVFAAQLVPLPESCAEKRLPESCAEQKLPEKQKRG